MPSRQFGRIIGHMICSDTESPNRRERKVIETRNAIVEAGKELIKTQGFAETTVDQIAEKADIAPRTFFRYFPSKESLLFAEFDAQREEMVAQLEARPEDEDIFDTLAIVLRRFSEMVDERWDDYVWVHEIIRSQDTSGSHERAVARQHFDGRVAAVIASRIGADPSTDPRPLAWAMTILAVFGQSVSKGPGASPTGKTWDTFLTTLAETQTALGQMRTAALSID